MCMHNVFIIKFTDNNKAIINKKTIIYINLMHKSRL